MDDLDNLLTPMSISYLDLFIYAGENGELSEETMHKVKTNPTKDEILALPDLPNDLIYTLLYKMGVDTGMDVEERHCYYRPECMKSSAFENSPIIYGKVFFGYLRTDREFKALCREKGIVV